MVPDYKFRNSPADNSLTVIQTENVYSLKAFMTSRQPVGNKEGSHTAMPIIASSEPLGTTRLTGQATPLTPLLRAPTRGGGGVLWGWYRLQAVNKTPKRAPRTGGYTSNYCCSTKNH